MKMSYFPFFFILAMNGMKISLCLTLIERHDLKTIARISTKH